MVITVLNISLETLITFYVYTCIDAHCVNIYKNKVISIYVYIHVYLQLQSNIHRLYNVMLNDMEDSSRIK